ncbi:MAG: prolyl oligopeptidase family serine peptidase [Gemmataceae bacterium]|nr:prolyl oligopeptidase family serine peptidase [Gemmataceae bacterium]
MKRFPLLCVAAFLCLGVALLDAQQFKPPDAKAPDAETLKAIAAKMEKLDKAGNLLRKQNVPDALLAEIEIYHKAAQWIVRHGEWYTADTAAWTLEALDRGLLRASQLTQGESPWLHQTGQAVVRGYRSRVDGSVQPYAITAPADFGKDPRKKWRLDVVLHGRDASITEVKFLHQHNGDKAAPKDLDHVRLEIFGRTNNAYRWAGETDVFEALDSFLAVERAAGRPQSIDRNKIVLRGFSMGGAGTWHLGLHHPDRWAVIGPGAGFTTTHGYIKDLPAQLPAYQEATLRIYDALDYAENAFDVPVVAYSGEKDAQKAAADNIEKKLKTLGISMTHLIAPGLEHSFPADWQKKAEEVYAKYASKGRPEYPPKVRFVTYTLKYPACAWVEILSLDKHYDRASVDAEKTETGFTVKSANVRALGLTLPEQVTLPLVVSIDGQEVNARPSISRVGQAAVYLEKRDGKWSAVLPQKLATDRARRLQKINGLQGPIDDAFMDGFLCVRGTGKPWHAGTQKYADANLHRFKDEWNKYLRGDLPIKDDVDVTEDDITAKNLILFGDPSSNSLIAQCMDGLPLKWTKESIAFGGKTVSAADHVPVLIYPSPLNSGRYVVLNSGHTFHADAFRGTNALLYPRLGDYAILKPAPKEKDPLAVEIVGAGIFDEFWQVKKE